LVNDDLVGAVMSLPGYKKYPGDLIFGASLANWELFRERMPTLPVEDADGTIAQLDVKVPEIAVRQRLAAAEGGELWAHQNDGLDIIGSRDYFAFFDDMGTGKSAEIIQGACELYARGKITRALVVSTTRGKRAFMSEQLPQWTPKGFPLHAALYPQGKQAKSVAWSSPDYVAGKGLLMAVASPGAFQSDTQAKMMAKFCSNGVVAMFLDESQNFKGWSTKRMEWLKHLRRYAKYRYIFTGEPTPLGYIDLFAQFYFLDPNILGHSSIYSFIAQYCYKGGFEGREIVGYRNLDLLFKRIAPHSRYLPIEQCMSMPGRQWAEMAFEPTAEQRRIYARLEDEFIIMAEDGTVDRELTTAVAKVNAMAQVANGWYYRTESHEDEPERRDTIRLNDERARYTLEEAAGDARKCIIWARYHADLELLTEVATDMGVYPLDATRDGKGKKLPPGTPRWVEISGRVSVAESDRARDAFINRDDVQWLFGTVATGGESLNLQVASRMVYFSNSYNFGHRAQSERRIWRAGQTEPCWYVDVVGFPIDQLIRRNLKDKRDMASRLKNAAGLKDLARELKELRDGA
jgi:hypothetical protein